MPNEPKNLIDPHLVFANGQNVDIADLNMFVELTVTQRGVTGNNNNSINPVVISLLGSNTKGIYTTDFTENLENFGITKIDYKMSSSYVPQVDIEFMDARGQSLFNDFIDSRYKILFDFPPPLFTLTLKGFYGQSVTSDLHLLRMTTSFNENASFVIKASFVGMTYAPLADLLFDYLLVAPFMNNTRKEDLLHGTIDTTYKLVYNYANNLIPKIKTVASKEISDLNTQQEIINELLDLNKSAYLPIFISLIEDIGDSGSYGGVGQNKPIVIFLSKTNKNIVYIKLKHYSAISGSGLVIAPGLTIFDGSGQFLINPNLDNSDTIANQIYENLTIKLNDISQNFSKNNVDIKIPKLSNSLSDLNNFITPKNIDGYVNITPKGIDFTGIDGKISSALKLAQQKQINLKNKTTNKISTVLFKDFPKGPTLRNVLRILLSDALVFINLLQTVIQNVQKSPKRLSQTTGINGDEPYSTPFPKYSIPQNSRLNDGTIVNDNRRILSIPLDKTNDWFEVDFVDSFMSKKIAEQSFANAQTKSSLTTNDSFIPINPFDSAIFDNNNPYLLPINDATKYN